MVEGMVKMKKLIQIVNDFFKILINDIEAWKIIVTSCVVAFLTGTAKWIANQLIKKRKQKIDERRKEFGKSLSILKEKRYILYWKAKRIYNNLYKYQIEKGEIELNYLMTKSEWIPKDKNGSLFFNSDNVKVRLIEDYKDRAKKIKAVYLPDPKKGYAENVNDLRRNTGIQEMTCGDAFRLVGYVTDITKKKVILDVAKSDYFKFQDTCEILSYEMAEWVSRNGERHQPSIKYWRRKNLLPLRRYVKDILNFDNRHVGIGINTLTIIMNAEYKEKKGNYFLLHYRGVSTRTEAKTQNNQEFERYNEVGEAMSTFHVVPAGTYQPLGREFTRFALDKDIKNTVIREFGEELLGLEHLNRLEDVIANNIDVFFRRDERLMMLYEGINKTDSKIILHFFGIGIDVLSTKCEMMTCLQYDSSVHPELALDKLILNYEGGKMPPIIEEFTEDNLKLWKSKPETLPVAAEILQIACDNYKQLVEGFK